MSRQYLVRRKQFAAGSLQFVIVTALLSFIFTAKASNIFSVDTMTYSINLDIPENAYLKQLPEDILKGYVKGKFHAYYPKREMNEILLDDFLAHYGKANFECGPGFCWDDYADHPYLKELYDKFKHTIRYREIVYYDAQHSVVKREVAWIQLMYTDYNYNGDLQSINGPKFWLMKLNKDNSIRIPNADNRAKDRTIQQEFDERHFVPNEIWDEKRKEKSGKMDDANEN